MKLNIQTLLNVIISRVTLNNYSPANLKMFEGQYQAYGL